ncbi:hypothetical protein L3Y34_019856 [Caenorhabditis briggsae]|uniref:Uncharacterized protein n=1 Tax=Caenorhabditis briggsae TaxID=6238 RepID=A0AAE9DP81_CAEBR|nr:hypothetical protein L3Y34_019856 [Caenorhabditis briggsae]
MKFSVKNAKDDSVMVLVDCDSFMFKIKNPKSQKGLVTQQLQVLKKGEVMEVGLEFRSPDIPTIQSIIIVHQFILGTTFSTSINTSNVNFF